MTARALAIRLAEAGVLVAALFLPLSIVGQQVGGGMMALGALGSWALGARRLLPRGIVAPVLAFIAVCLISTLASPVDVPWRSWSAWRPVLFVLLVPAAMASCPRPERLLRASLLLLLGSALLAALLGLWQRKSGFDLNFWLGVRREPIRIEAPGGEGYAAVGTFNSRLTFSAIEVAVLVLATGLALTARTWAARIGSALVAAASAAAVAAAFARAAWIGFFAGVVALSLGLRRRAALAALGVALLAAGAGAAIPSIRARAVSAMQTTANSDRLFIWSRAGEVLADYPVQGVGVYAYPIVAGPYYDRHDPLFPMRTWAHDMYLTLLVETGIAGLIAYLWIFAAVIALARRGLAEDSPEWRSARLGALGATAALLGVSLFHDVLYDGEVAMTLFFLAGLALSDLSRRQEPEPG